MADQKACSRIEQRSVIKFLVAEGCKPIEIHRRMSTVYGATCFSQKNVYKWAKLFKEGRSSGKVMLTVFWDMQGPITISFLEKGSTVNSANYCELLRQVKKDIKNKRRGHQSKGVILHHDNARPHTAAQTVQTINELGWELLPHPPYSPDLAPSDFHLFGPLKAFTRGTKFESDDEVKSVVSDWLRHQSKDFYAEGIRKLVHRWEKCVTVLGDYVEKLKKHRGRESD
ncbi:histone-lysine N-methyltransferase SETMAR [Lates calcarifer]|uniref:Histone-lysine N-methyltransferase SETMAR n=2 Tax=Lates calcarifer TaxID=8187 RepID=A0AAJ8B4B3_LATCA|nr:histone-lysine N-methyltransferase SETMAR [Lates calcarifer]